MLDSIGICKNDMIKSLLIYIQYFPYLGGSTYLELLYN